jgi:hypothetical protein
MLVKCKKQNCNLCGEELLEEHHIIPKTFAYKKSETGSVVKLCKKHHDILHKMMLKWIWKFVDDKHKEECKKEIKRKTHWFLNIEKNL